MRKLNAATEIPPPLELECLQVLWALGEANVKQVRENLDHDRSLAYTTVMTVLERLVRRKCVARRKIGRSFVYGALTSRESVRRIAVKDLVDSFFEGSEDQLREYLGLSGSVADVTLRDSAVEARLDAALL